MVSDTQDRGDDQARGARKSASVDFDIFGGDDATAPTTNSDRAVLGMNLDFDLTAESSHPAPGYEADNTDMDADDATRFAAPGVVVPRPTTSARGASTSDGRFIPPAPPVVEKVTGGYGKIIALCIIAAAIAGVAWWFLK